jgi:site-specific recombinase XerC
MMKLVDAHNKFLDYLEVIKNKSPKTVEQYDRHLKKLLQFLDNPEFLVSDITLDEAD